jgi:anti-anti-sigma factor
VRYDGHPEIVVHRDRPGASVVALSGEHDQYSAPGLAKAIEQELEAGNDVVIDLGRAGFLDSTNAAVLLAANENAATRSLRLVVLLSAAAGPAVHRLFETARLGMVLTVVTTSEAALQLVEQRSGRDRRSGSDRRAGAAGAPEPVRRTGPERRSGGERRAA